MKISRTHLDTVVKILGKEKFMREQVFKKSPTKMKKKVEEMEYCISFIQKLFEEYEVAKNQKKLF